jgi:hypothetical protein
MTWLDQARLLARMIREALAPPKQPERPDPEERLSVEERELLAARRERDEQRAGTVPWNYRRPRTAKQRRDELEYLLDVHGPDEVARRLVKAAAKSRR